VGTKDQRRQRSISTWGSYAQKPTNNHLKDKVEVGLWEKEEMDELSRFNRTTKRSKNKTLIKRSKAGTPQKSEEGRGIDENTVAHISEKRGRKRKE